MWRAVRLSAMETEARALLQGVLPPRGRNHTLGAFPGRWMEDEGTFLSCCQPVCSSGNKALRSLSGALRSPLKLSAAVHSCYPAFAFSFFIFHKQQPLRSLVGCTAVFAVKCFPFRLLFFCFPQTTAAVHSLVSLLQSAFGSVCFSFHSPQTTAAASFSCLMHCGLCCGCPAFAFFPHTTAAASLSCLMHCGLSVVSALPPQQPRLAWLTGVHQADAIGALPDAARAAQEAAGVVGALDNGARGVEQRPAAVGLKAHGLRAAVAAEAAGQEGRVGRRARRQRHLRGRRPH